MMDAQSFTARRSAASNLPQFQLPPPDHMAGGMHKYAPAYAPSTTQQPTPAIVSSVLTPPSGLQTDLSPLGSASVNSQSSASSAGGVPPYQPMGYWPTPGNPSYNFSQAPSMPPTFAQGPTQSYMGRQLYSPPMGFPNRNTNSPTATDGLPPPPYDISLPAFPSMSGGQPQGMSHATQQSQQSQQHAQQHAQQQQQSNQQPPPQSQPQHQQSHMNPQQGVSQAPPQGPLHAPNFGERAPPTPSNYNHYTPSSTPQQSSFPAFTQQSPPQQSPNTSSAPSNRISPVSAQPHPQMAAPQGYSRPPFGGYNLPAMAGPIMSNVHSPGGQMALVGGMNMPYPGHQMNAPMYGHHPHQQPQNDRPFKCDQCPQSFNRNHDLKRHKRIHLAVKPFPCAHCEKSFSRKDALKRHILVKGCGSNAKGSGGDGSPVDKGEVMSDSTDGSPDMMKKEL